MSEQTVEVRIRTLEDFDLGDIVSLDEKISGEYRPDVWEARLGYYMRRDPEGARQWLANSGLSEEAQQEVVRGRRR